MSRLAGCIDRGLNAVEAEPETIRGYVKDIEAVAATLDPAVGSCADRQEKFEAIKDNRDLERWFRLPKSHERRIHGHRHAGVRIVQEGPTLVHALDAHVAHPEPFTVTDLLVYRTAREPPRQEQALDRRKIMRKARSLKNRPLLLADLERRYRESPVS